jgi:hypothetical protein
MMHSCNLTPIALYQTAAQKPATGAQAPTIHISVNALSFSDAIFAPVRQTGVWRWAQLGIQEEAIMRNGKMGFSAAGQAWMAWPTDVAQTAVAVIARTRQEWASRGDASSSPDEIDVDRTRIGHPLFRLARDAKTSSGRRAQRVRAGSRRRQLMAIA